MSTPDLIEFMKKCRKALRESTGKEDESMIFVKENCCEDGPGGAPTEFLDEEDSSMTR